MTRRFALLVNPSASGGRVLAAVEPACEELRRLGAEFRVVESGDLEHARAAAAAAAEGGETVVAVGGDGIVGPIAGVMRRRSVPLAIVPAGRGNDFARVLRIPLDPAAAARLAVEGEERLVDVGAVNGRPFVGIASLGFDSEANRIANEARFVRGNLVYLYAALRALAGWRHATFDVTVDDQLHRVTGYTVAVANSKAYGGGMFLFPHARLDDGRLEVLLLAEHSKVRFLRSIPRVFRGERVDDPLARFLSGTRVVIEADRPFTVYADGDPIAELPVTVTVEARVLRLIAPPAEAR